MVRELRGGDLTPANEALMFSIYYAAITSMEEDDVSNLFAVSCCVFRARLIFGGPFDV
jgi:hypothetical protein